MRNFISNRHVTWRWLMAAGLSLGALVLGTAVSAKDRDDAPTKWPIKHVVVIFQENVSFDHYFGTYPTALNPEGQPTFKPRPGTPSVDGLTGALLTANPNSHNPFRLDRSQAATCDQDHDYGPEQEAYDAGLVDKFVEFVGLTSPTCKNFANDKTVVMGYFDGNTVTALWNYAQHFAMSDNSFNTTFGPSTPGHLNLIAGQTHGAIPVNKAGDTVQGTVIGDPQPFYDDCDTRETVAMSGLNVGDLLNAKGLTWGWFQGGFTPTGVSQIGKAVCGSTHIGSDGNPKGDYIPHHEPFQYYQQTANPKHFPPTAVNMIGQTDQANHQYDLTDFWKAAKSGHLPAVSYLKAPGYRDGHAGYSDPLAEQTFLVETINRLQLLPEWDEMAIMISWDDSDGWYDHVMPPIVSQSSTSADALTAPSHCGTTPAGAYPGRCGYGPRLPLLVISPFANVNFVDHTVTDQSSILRFIEDNWNLGRIGNQSFDEKAGSLENLFNFSKDDRAQRLFLDPTTGLKIDTAPAAQQ